MKTKIVLEITNVIVLEIIKEIQTLLKIIVDVTVITKHVNKPIKNAVNNWRFLLSRMIFLKIIF